MLKAESTPVGDRLNIDHAMRMGFCSLGRNVSISRRLIRTMLYPILVLLACFAVGILFSFFLIVTLTVNFLGTYQVSESVANQISLGSYISTVVSVTFAVGIVFELPILVYFLTKIGVITPDFLKKNRKYMFVILLLLSAIITPPDMFSQVLVVLPLLVLYEFSIGVSKRVYKKEFESIE